MSFTRTIKIMLQNGADRMYSRMAHNNEIKKFKDSRRVAIAQQYPLSKEQKEEIDGFILIIMGRKLIMCGIRIMLHMQTSLTIDSFQNYCLFLNLKSSKTRILQPIG